MRILLAVIEDLYTFAVGTLLGWRPAGITEPRLLPSSRIGVPISAEEDVALATAVRGTKPVEVLAEPRLLVERTVAYCAQEGVVMRETPEPESTPVGRLSYGEMVMVLETGMERTKVATNGTKGYVPTALLARSAAEVYPDFEIGKEYGPHAAATVRLRTFIKDEFAATLAALPLSSHEYAYYRLLRRGARIAWPDIRPRTPGSWAAILATAERVIVSHEPQPGAVMEYLLAEARGHLAYVEEVFADGSIKISEADWPDRGIYNERVLVEGEWKALQPSFIVVG